MRALNIVELSGNDGWQIAARKINDNFMSLYGCVQSNNDVAMRSQSDDFDTKLQEAESRIYRRINDVVDDIDESLEKLEERLKGLIDAIDTIPPIGTWLYAEYDPNEQWPGTEWVKAAEGNFLISAGSKYLKNGSYGSNEITLTKEQIPAHSHVLPVHTSFEQSSGFGLVESQYFTDQVITTGIINRLNSESTGGSKPHSNIPQSIAMTLWHRTS